MTDTEFGAQLTRLQPESAPRGLRGEEDVRPGAKFHELHLGRVPSHLLKKGV